MNESHTQVREKHANNHLNFHPPVEAFMSQVIKEIEYQLERGTQRYLHGDADKVTLLYAEDAILLSDVRARGASRTNTDPSLLCRQVPSRKPIGSTLTPYTRILGGVAVNTGVYKFELDKKPDEGRGRTELPHATRSSIAGPERTG